jgi:hypothetical protein
MARAPLETTLSRARLTSGPSAHGAHILAVVFGLLPTLSVAAGSPTFAPRIKSVHELIVEGDRPEISACLYSAQLAVSKSHEFERIRWSDRISDESVVREYRLAADWVRVTKFEASALTQGTGLFFRQRPNAVPACSAGSDPARRL